MTDISYNDGHYTFYAIIHKGWYVNVVEFEEESLEVYTESPRESK